MYNHDETTLNWDTILKGDFSCIYCLTFVCVWAIGNHFVWVIDDSDVQSASSLFHFSCIYFLKVWFRLLICLVRELYVFVFMFFCLLLMTWFFRWRNIKEFHMIILVYKKYGKFVGICWFIRIQPSNRNSFFKFIFYWNHQYREVL